MRQYEAEIKDASDFDKKSEEYVPSEINGKYVDPSEFLMTPLPIADYYKDITRSEYLTIFQSAMLVGNQAVPLRLFTATAASYKYYHLVLDERILDLSARMNEVLILSIYLRNLFYLAYKEEVIYKTFSRPEHRHMMRRSVSCRLRMILAQPIFPARRLRVYDSTPYNWHTNNKNIYTLGREIYPQAQTIARVDLFSGGMGKYLRLPFPTEVYLTGSLNTAASIRVPRVLTVEEGKTAAFSAEQDVLWYREHYGTATDIDVMVYVGGDGNRAELVTACTGMIVDALGRDGIPVTELTVGNRRKITSGNVTFDIFPIFYHPASIVYNFHVPSVRSYWDVKANQIIDFPSFVYAGLSGICLDYRYFSSSVTQADIINKYVWRGFKFILNQKEMDVSLFQIGYTVDENQIWTRPVGFRPSVAWEFITATGAGPAIGWRIDPLRRGLHNKRLLIRWLLAEEHSVTRYGVNISPFWSNYDRRFIVPNYPNFMTPNLVDKERSQLTPEDVLRGLRAGGLRTGPMEITDINESQIYVLVNGMMVVRTEANSKTIGAAIPRANGFRGEYVTITLPRPVSTKVLVFVWRGLAGGTVSKEQLTTFSYSERKEISMLLVSLGTPPTNRLYLWLNAIEAEAIVAPDISTIVQH